MFIWLLRRLPILKEGSKTLYSNKSLAAAQLINLYHCALYFIAHVFNINHKDHISIDFWLSPPTHILLTALYVITQGVVPGFVNHALKDNKRIVDKFIILLYPFLYIIKIPLAYSRQRLLFNNRTAMITILARKQSFDFSY